MQTSTAAAPAADSVLDSINKELSFIGASVKSLDDKLHAWGRNNAKQAKTFGTEFKRSALMPFQQAGAVGRGGTMDAVAATLPVIAKAAEPQVKKKLEEKIKELSDGVKDPTTLLEGWSARLIQQVWLHRRMHASAKEYAELSSEGVIDKLEINLSNVKRAVAEDIEGKRVSRFMLDVDADIFVVLSELSVQMRPKCSPWDMFIVPIRVRVVGPLRVHWDTKTGELCGLVKLSSRLPCRQQRTEWHAPRVAGARTSWSSLTSSSTV